MRKRAAEKEAAIEKAATRQIDMLASQVDGLTKQLEKLNKESGEMKAEYKSAEHVSSTQQAGHGGNSVAN